MEVDAMRSEILFVFFALGIIIFLMVTLRA
jgi:hypothetical protein